MAWKIIHSNRAAEQIRKLDRQVAKRVMARLDRLMGDPHAHGAVKLQGQKDLYRVRVGDYRIVYRIDNARNLIETAVIAHRSEVYRDL